jgi:ribosomal protein L12E/L44/L45/RPP1/RPP2
MRNIQTPAVTPMVGGNGLIGTATEDTEEEDTEEEEEEEEDTEEKEDSTNLVSVAAKKEDFLIEDVFKRFSISRCC